MPAINCLKLVRVNPDRLWAHEHKKNFLGPYNKYDLWILTLFRGETRYFMCVDPHKYGNCYPGVTVEVRMRGVFQNAIRDVTPALERELITVGLERMRELNIPVLNAANMLNQSFFPCFP